MGIGVGNELAILAEAALALREGVDADARAALCLPFDEDERRTWFYWPDRRRGLTLHALNGTQRQLVDAVVTAMVATPTLARVTTIMGLDVVLADLESGGALTRRRPDALPRDPSAYATTIFGEPGDGVWGVRFEGHHVSVHTTVTPGGVATTPIFLGTNPARITHAGRTLLRPLGPEEDMGRELLGALDAAARRRAVIDDTAPADIVTTNAPRVDHDLSGGIAIADLHGEAADIAGALIALHTGRTRLPVAPVDVRDVHFAWAGDAEVGRPHYYRLAGPRFLVEYDNTQNDANHAHSVWRDPGDDFGGDLLRRHHAADHAGDHTGGAP